MPDKISILFLGDIIGRPGRKVLKRCLPSFIEKYSPSIVVANGENAAGGIGITEEIGRELLAQVDVLTSGNHIFDKKEAESYLDREPRLLRPANYPSLNPGKFSTSVVSISCPPHIAPATTRVLNLALLV